MWHVPESFGVPDLLHNSNSLEKHKHFIMDSHIKLPNVTPQVMSGKQISNTIPCTACSASKDQQSLIFLQLSCFYKSEFTKPQRSHVNE